MSIDAYFAGYPCNGFEAGLDSGLCDKRFSYRARVKIMQLPRVVFHYAE